MKNLAIGTHQVVYLRFYWNNFEKLHKEPLVHRHWSPFWNKTKNITINNTQRSSHSVCVYIFCVFLSLCISPLPLLISANFKLLWMSQSIFESGSKMHWRTLAMHVCWWIGWYTFRNDYSAYTQRTPMLASLLHAPSHPTCSTTNAFYGESSIHYTHLWQSVSGAIKEIRAIIIPQIDLHPSNT